VSEMAYAHSGLQLEKINFDFQIHEDLLAESQPYHHAAWLWFPTSYIEKQNTAVNEIVSSISGEHVIYSYKKIENHSSNNVELGILIRSMNKTTLESDLEKVLR
jgi:hypothetical protein